MPSFPNPDTLIQVTLYGMLFGEQIRQVGIRGIRTVIGRINEQIRVRSSPMIANLLVPQIVDYIVLYRD